MASVALINILSGDAVGLVAAIADQLYDAGVNLRDTSFATLGHGGKFSALCDLPDGLEAAELQRDLARLPVLAGAEIAVTPYRFDPSQGPTGRITHYIVATGGDQLGLIARLADVFAQYGSNIVRLDARKMEGQQGEVYTTRLAVWIAPASASNCLATVKNTAGTLGLECKISEVRS